jgi:hypothetical protein
MTHSRAAGRALRRIPVEPRLILAYGLILLMVTAFVAGALFMRHNSWSNRTARDAKRDRARREAKLPD